MNNKKIASISVLVCVLALLIATPIKISGFEGRELSKVLKNSQKNLITIPSQENSNFEINLPKSLSASSLAIGLYNKTTKTDLGQIFYISESFVKDNPTFIELSESNDNIILVGPKLKNNKTRYWVISPDGKADFTEITKNSKSKLTSLTVSKNSVWGPGEEFYSAAKQNISKIKNKRLLSKESSEITSLIVFPTSPVQFDISTKNDSKVLIGTIAHNFSANSDYILALGKSKASNKNYRKLSIIQGNSEEFKNPISYTLSAGIKTRATTTNMTADQCYGIISDPNYKPPKGKGINDVLVANGCCDVINEIKEKEKWNTPIINLKIQALSNRCDGSLSSGSSTSLSSISSENSSESYSSIESSSISLEANSSSSDSSSSDYVSNQSSSIEIAWSDSNTSELGSNISSYTSEEALLSSSNSSDYIESYSSN